MQEFVGHQDLIYQELCNVIDWYQLTLRTYKIKNEDARVFAQKYLDLGEFCLDKGIQFVQDFKTKRLQAKETKKIEGKSKEKE